MITHFDISFRKRLSVILLSFYFLLYVVAALQCVKNFDFLILAIKIIRVFIVLISLLIVYFENNKIILNYKNILLFTPVVLGVFCVTSVLYLDYVLLVLLVLIFYNISKSSLFALVSITSYLYFIFLCLILLNFKVNLLDLNIVQETNERVRNTLGFYNVNASGLIFTISTMLFIIIDNKLMLIVNFALGILLYYYTDTRSLIVSLFMILFYFLVVKIKYTNVIYIFSLSLVVLTFFFPFIVKVLLGLSVFGVSVDELISGRLTFASELMDSFSSITLFTGNFNLEPIDNFSLNLFIVTGVLLYSFVFFLLLVKLKNNKEDYKCNIFVSYFLLIGMFEAFYSSGNIITILFFLFLISADNIFMNKVSVVN